MNRKLGMVLRQLHRSEHRLADLLRRVADRHQADHEIHLLARDLAGWSQRHVAALAQRGRDRGLSLPETVDPPPRLLARARQRASRLSGRSHPPALLLLADLRRVYREASGVSVDWELLAQGAQAQRDSGLLELAQQCHPDTLRQVRWANAKLKELAGQALAGR